jgi:hypothetical protein
VEACKTEISECLCIERQLTEENQQLRLALSKASKVGNPDDVSAAMSKLHQNEDSLKQASAALAAANLNLSDCEKATRIMEMDAVVAEQDLGFLTRLSEHDQRIASLKALLEHEHANLQAAQAGESVSRPPDSDRADRERELATLLEAKAALEEVARLASMLQKHKDDANRHMQVAASAESQAHSMRKDFADLLAHATTCKQARQHALLLGHLAEASAQQHTAEELKVGAEKKEHLAATADRDAVAVKETAETCHAASVQVQRQLMLAKCICVETENALLATQGELRWANIARLAKRDETKALAEAERELDRAFEAEQRERHTLAGIYSDAGVSAAQQARHSAQLLRAQACTAWAARATAQTAAAAARSELLAAESSAAVCREDSIVAKKHLGLLRAAMAMVVHPKLVHDKIAAAESKIVDMQGKSSEVALAATRLCLHSTGIRKQALAQAAVGDHQASSASFLKYRELFALAAAAQAHFAAAASETVCVSADLQLLRTQSTVQNHVLDLIAALDKSSHLRMENEAASRHAKSEVLREGADVAALKRELAHLNLQQRTFERQAKADGTKSADLEAHGHVQNAAAAANVSNALQLQSQAVAEEVRHVSAKLEAQQACLRAAEVRLQECTHGVHREKAMGKLLLQALLLVVEIGQAQQETGSLQCKHQLAVLQVRSTFVFCSPNVQKCGNRQIVARPDAFNFMLYAYHVVACWHKLHCSAMLG